MLIGAVFPQLEIGSKSDDIKTWAEHADALKYDHIAMFDHILGVNAKSQFGWKGPYDHTHPFHEPLITMSYMSAVTKKVGFATSILVLPQRQAALVAKQVSTLCQLSKRTIRLGVGSGWNKSEFEAIGYDFNTRGKKIEDQINIMRQLWNEDSVNVNTDHHRITDAGINPLPDRSRIEIWLGGGAKPVLQRVGRMADGWFANTSTRTAKLGIPAFSNDKYGLSQLDIIRRAALEADRDPTKIGVEVRVELEGKTPEEAANEVNEWSKVPEITAVQFSTMRAEIKTVNGHINALERFMNTLKN
ncbi:MAG: LLM class F420-dependent oxidoreductase [Dehalococcoidia bacterium]|nr:LLM class F420-dependent oxidoreductase [Dehalococcoidia bacterium]MQG16276.1 TIGR03619 family F420-dependent LLM class oxidoreductase [SAR202 cluster bacterium]|tara:strand:- start:23949 stop:24854 length:906 start_codon:yes stop_codon:yes gene_type:complete